MENFQPDQPAVQSYLQDRRFSLFYVFLPLSEAGGGSSAGISCTADTTAGVTQAAVDDAREEIENKGNGRVYIAEKVLSGTSEMLQPES